MTEIISNFVQTISIIFFILAIKGLSCPASAQKGNFFGMIAVGISALVPLLYAFSIIIDCNGSSFYYIMTIVALFFGGTIGICIAKKINMTALPQLVAAFHSLVGLSAVLVSAAVFCMQNFSEAPNVSLFPILKAFELSLGAAVGAATFSGSLVAFGKLQGLFGSKQLAFPQQRKKINLSIAATTIFAIAFFMFEQSTGIFVYIILSALTFGYLLTIPIGGADMPVVVSMLNSYSGWAAALVGFTINNNILIVVGALVGTSGAVLSKIMCDGMNRSLLSVVFGGISGNVGNQNIQTPAEKTTNHNTKVCSPEDAAFIIKNARSVIIVPGYGMAVAHAQHAIKEIADAAKSFDIDVKYAIHPVAGRMPGHMNVLLAEANIPYEDVLEIDEVNPMFARTDVALVIGANDITNSSAKNDPSSSIYGMPILEVEKAKTVLFVKRSMAFGYAGIGNPLFFKANTMMIFGDARKVCEEISKKVNDSY